MHKILIPIILLLISFSCKKDKPYVKKLIFYTDSTFKKKSDSILIDSLDQVKKEGFVKIFNNNDKSFEQGKITRKGVKTGKWDSYIDMLDKNILDEERIYSKYGLLINYKSFDHTTGNITVNKNYIGDNLVGIQKEFYPSGKLLLQYETDSEGYMINDYTVLSETGKEIFASHLGKEGSGYVKYYDKTGNIVWEGQFKNKKKEGWHHDYLTEHDGKITEIKSTLYQDDKIIQTKTTKK